MGHLKKWAKKLTKSFKKHLGLDDKDISYLRSSVLSSNVNSAKASRSSYYGKTGTIVGRY